MESHVKGIGAKRVSLFALLAMFGALVGTADGKQVTLTDRNSSIVIDSGASAGMSSWTVDGVGHLSQQWLWYRVGSSGPEMSIDTLVEDLDSPKVSDADLDVGDERALLRYMDSQGRFMLEVDYILTGGNPGSGTADVAEIISVHNATDDPLEIHLFQYSNFDLNDNEIDQLVEITNGNTASQSDGVFQSGLSETVVVPRPNHFEVGTAPGLLGKLEDGDADSFSDQAGPLDQPADYAWGFQWDVVIPARGSFVISKDKHLEETPPIPEPATLTFIGLGALAMVRRRRESAS